MKRSAKSYALLIALIALTFSLPKSYSDSLRGFVATVFRPFWITLVDAKSLIASDEKSPYDLKLQKLQLENRLLNAEVERLQELLKQECSLQVQLKTTAFDADEKNEVKTLLQRHREHLLNRLSFQLQAVPAQVIFRSPSSWNSSLWLNVGTAENEKMGSVVIEKNSPVVLGTSIVGVVDYVEKNQCRVRLITDSGLCPSVRAVRGDLNKRMISEQLAILLNRFSCCHGYFTNQEEKENALKQLTILRRKFSQNDDETFYLAKGELHGSSQPLWHAPGAILKGIGFNYDFSDEEGPARDLRTGIALDGSNKDKAVPILRENDLLVTTGMDGIFPAGFYVAEVTKIHLLREGDYFYELEASPTAGDLEQLQMVYILPPNK